MADGALGEEGLEPNGALRANKIMHKVRKDDVNDKDINLISSSRTGIPAITHREALKHDMRMHDDNIVIEDAKNGKGSMTRAIAYSDEQLDVAVLAITSREAIPSIMEVVFA